MYADSSGEASMLFCMLDIPKKVIPTLGETTPRMRREYGIIGWMS